LWTCTPRTAEEVVAVCEWARLNGYTVRPRGLMHGFSPLTVTSETTAATKVLLVDTTVHLHSMTMIPRSGNQPPMVKVQSGATIDALMDFLEQQSGGKGAAPGYSFPHIPATGNLTMGGVLAINGHGTAIPVHGGISARATDHSATAFVHLQRLSQTPMEPGPIVMRFVNSTVVKVTIEHSWSTWEERSCWMQPLKLLITTICVAKASWISVPMFYFGLPPLSLPLDMKV
jgi:FAD binding domain